MGFTPRWKTLGALATAALIAAAADDPRSELDKTHDELFEEAVYPVLEKNCIRCHGGTSATGEVKARGGLELTSRPAILEGGDTGPAVDLETPSSSLLLEMVSYKDEDHQMPPKGKLPQEDIDTLTRWVALGIPWSGGSTAEPATRPAEKDRDLKEEIERESKEYWAYQPVRRPTVPQVKTPGWQEHPIDAFLASKLEAKGLSPNPRASKLALIRRVSYDLTGLPPSPREVEAFVHDTSPDAYERLVDRLLASPHFGEKWARHWLDLVRYAESNGYERDSDKAEIWRYRDYVIRAFNDDVPYDRFIREQLAGDELDQVTVDSLVATGFHRLHLWDDEPVDREQARYDNIDDIVRTTAEGFLGMTLGCARCHDHKKDPIEQRDYYSFAAFFHNITPMGTNDVFRSLDDVRAMCVAERGRSAPDMYVHIRGNASAPGEKVEPAFPAVLRPPKPVIPELPDGVQSTGRRRALADWIASKDNPLTARVLVNRLWQHYFGRAIVGTPNDLGKLGEAPTHPELLDWLAAELMAGGWKLKRMHKLILLSNAYPMSSGAHETALKADPENILVWRHAMRRLTAEEIRDSILAVSGTINPTMFGPSVFPELPEEVLATSSTGAGKWGRSSKEEAARRSIYVKVKRSLLVPLLTDFDFADTDSPCAVRFTSTVPTQALGMLNSKFVNDQAALFAERLRRDHPDDREAQVRRGLELVTGHRAGDEEVQSCLAFLEKIEQDHALDEGTALNRFALLALNLNEFIYLD